MTEHHSDDHPAKVDKEDVRAGTKGYTKYVLVISLVAIVIIMILVLGFGSG